MKESYFLIFMQKLLIASTQIFHFSLLDSSICVRLRIIYIKTSDKITYKEFKEMWHVNQI